MLPMLGWNAGTTCANNLVGSAQEIVTLGTSLFNDFDEDIQRHIVHTSWLCPKDPKTFSLSAPDRASIAHLHAWEGVPYSKRIIQDFSKLANNASSIAEHQGCVAPGSGHRGYRHSSTDKSKWDGKRIRLLMLILCTMH